MSTDFETLRATSLVLGPAARAFRGVATTFEIRGHRAALVVPDITTLKALCKEWAIEAPLSDVAEPVIVVSRFMVKPDEEDDGLGDGISDGLDDGL